MSIDSTTIALMVAIRDHRSVSTAAAATYMSAAAASRRISALEAIVGGPVVDRGGGRPAELTELGRRYVTWGEAAQRRFDALPSASTAEAGTDVIRVAVLGVALGETGPAILEEWRARWPGVRLAFVGVDSHTQADPLASADIVYGQLLGDEAHELGWTSHTTVTAERAVVVPRSSDLADADWLTPGDVADAEWLYPEPGSARYARWMDDLPLRDASRDTILETPDEVARAVEVTGNVALHTMLAAGAFETTATRFVPLAGRRLQVGVGIRADDERPALRGLYDLSVMCHNNLGALNHL